MLRVKNGMGNIILLLVVLATIFATEPTSAKKCDKGTGTVLGGCYCHHGRGTFCGSTKRIGQVSGDCSEHDLYYCSSGGGSLSKWEGNCKRGCYAATGGKDYCK